MSTEHDAFGDELARISKHQSDATTARFQVFEALARAGSHPWISESSAPHGAEQAFENGWFEGVRAPVRDRTAVAAKSRPLLCGSCLNWDPRRAVRCRARTMRCTQAQLGSAYVCCASRCARGC